MVRIEKKKKRAQNDPLSEACLQMRVWKSEVRYLKAAKPKQCAKGC